MAPKRIVLIHFSGTRTTKKTVDAIAREFSAPVKEYDLREINPSSEVELSPDDLAIVGMPVYSGRIPDIGRRRLAMFKGSKTPAIAVVVYGNRAFDDALAELADLLNESGFTTFAGGAFLAEHCIFPNVAAGRPDAADMEKISAFAKACAAKLSAGATPVDVPGNRPYLVPPKGAGLKPTIDDGTCILCGACVAVCPNGALFLEPEAKGMRKNPERCVACTACVKVCPNGSQAYRGEQYEAIRKVFEEKFSARQEPQTFV